MTNNFNGMQKADHNLGGAHDEAVRPAVSPLHGDRLQLSHLGT